MLLMGSAIPPSAIDPGHVQYPEYPSSIRWSLTLSSSIRCTAAPYHSLLLLAPVAPYSLYSCCCVLAPYSLYYSYCTIAAYQLLLLDVSHAITSAALHHMLRMHAPHP